MAEPRKRRINVAQLRERLYRRRFLLPNAVTIGSMFCGFLTTIYASTGRFEKAALAIGIAILLDGLDGRVARRFNATSKFGVEFDSFADLVSFGVAPAALMYYWCFQKMADEFGVFISFIFVLCAASRLARFNLDSESSRSFVGLPTPGSAGMVAALVNAIPVLEPSTISIGIGAVLMLILSFLMVSKVEFLSVKLLTVSRLRLISRLALGVTIALIWYNSRIGFFLLASAYCLSGPLGTLRRPKTGGDLGEAPATAGSQNILPFQELKQKEKS